ncbi:MAG: hypothetical protein DRR08_17145 [Candidatus Parabeggiatoa sp. nov. 2]|nr:MAG: hypothetical protein DRR08_17145 [Gammaproteobacteria bacterium]
MLSLGNLKNELNNPERVAIDTPMLLESKALALDVLLESKALALDVHIKTSDSIHNNVISTLNINGL